MQGFPQKTELTLCPCVYSVCEHREGTAAVVAAPRASWDSCSRVFWPEIPVALSPDYLSHFCVVTPLGLEGWSHQASLTSIQTMSLQQGRVIYTTGKVYSSESFLLRAWAVVWVNAASPFCEPQKWRLKSLDQCEGNKTILDLINRTSFLSWLRRDLFFLVHG